MGLDEFMKAFMAAAARAQARKAAADEEKMENEKRRARQVYRNGGCCINCHYRNYTGYCNNPNSLMYDKQYYDTEEIYDVQACPYWRRND